MSWVILAVVAALLGWSYDSRLIRSVAFSLRHREFTRHAVFSGMRTPQILIREHLPYVVPIVFFTAMNNLIWAIGLEVTLSILGFCDINRPSVGGMIYWANAHSAMVAGIWWWIAFPMIFVVILFLGLFMLAMSINEYIDPRSRLARMGGEMMPQIMAEIAPTAVENTLTIDRLKAYYINEHYGIKREIRAVDDISLDRAPQRDLRPGRQILQRQDLADQDFGRRHPPADAGGRRLGDVQFRRRDRRRLSPA